MAALEKRRRGETPTREEKSALRRFEKRRDEEFRQTALRSITKKEWRAWSGRQVKVLNEQAERYGLPIGGATIDLPAFVRALHDFLAANARKLAGSDDDDPDLAGAASPALEKQRQFKSRLLELQLLREQKQLIERRIVHDGHSRIGKILRVAGEALQRQFGTAAQKVLNDALDNCKREIDRLLSADGDTHTDAGGPG